MYEYNWFSQNRYIVRSPDALVPGKHTIRVEFDYDGGGVGKGGTATLIVDGQKVAEGRVEKTILGRFSADETFDTGLDTGSPVSDSYQSPFRFVGKLQKVDIDLASENLGKADLDELRQAETLFSDAQ